ncbi:phosphatase PAP2 family protein [Streptantibioticus cattleyicolor]|nr:phosphatase PAP2 family protein [Streptantibioticus cattleyicolor]
MSSPRPSPPTTPGRPRPRDDRPVHGSGPSADVSPARRRPAPRWWAELPLIALVYAAYSGGRLLVAGGTGSAVAHGEAIVRLEHTLRISPEHALNQLFTHQAWLGVPACFAYATLHYVITPAVLVWLWRRHSGSYLYMRTWLMISTLLGLIGFSLLPTAPPRLLPAAAGFQDTMAHFSHLGWWGADASAPQGLGGMTNQYAAMPSLHVGWALWCGVMLWRYAENRVLRVAGLAYPVAITFVVLGTANHYLLDAVAGVAVMIVGLLLTRPARHLTARVRSRFARRAAPAAVPAPPALVPAPRPAPGPADPPVAATPAAVAGPAPASPAGR